MSDPTTQGAEPALPPELLALDQMAASADAAIGAANQPAPPPGAADQADPAEELAGMLTLGVNIVGKATDLVPKYYPPEVCREIATQYMACAEKYGWTWHKEAGGPEIRLGLAIGAPAFMLYLEAKQRRADAEAKAKAAKNAGERLAPGGGLVPVVPN